MIPFTLNAKGIKFSIEIKFKGIKTYNSCYDFHSFTEIRMKCHLIFIANKIF